MCDISKFSESRMTLDLGSQSSPFCWIHHGAMPHCYWVLWNYHVPFMYRLNLFVFYSESYFYWISKITINNNKRNINKIKHCTTKSFNFKYILSRFTDVLGLCSFFVLYLPELYCLTLWTKFCATIEHIVLSWYEQCAYGCCACYLYCTTTVLSD